MKYWIIIDSWNLMETFTTESLSPHSFYLNRSFGNDLTRYISKDGELYYNLVLFKKEPIADFAIEIDSCLIDNNLIVRDKKNDAILYPQTIYFRKKLVRFRFKNEATLRGFIAESKIIIEVKNIEKYFDDFYVGGENAISIGRIKQSEMLPFELGKYVQQDNFFNSIKGGIVSYACGEKTTTSQESQSLLLSLISLKNAIAGLNTTIMIGEENILDYSPYMTLLEKTRKEYSKSGIKVVSNSFEVLKHLLDEIKKLSSLRMDTIAHQKSPSYAYEVAELEKKKERYKELLYSLEDSNIRQVKDELQLIKEQEVLNGEKEGKKRKYFPKGSPEYIRKQELKSIIDSYKEENDEYRNAYHEYKEIESSLANSVVGVTQYDSAISALFIRFSDNVNNIIKIIKSNLREENIKSDILPMIEINGGNIHIDVDSVNKEEVVVYNILLNCIVSNPNGKQSAVSDSKILDIVEETGRLFGKCEESKSECGGLILCILRNFWLYKNQRVDVFTIPDNLSVVQSIMSFLIKPHGFDQIDRFMLNRGYQQKKYAFLLLGSLIGYAALPKTLTNMLNDEAQETIIDDYLATIYRDIINKE